MAQGIDFQGFSGAHDRLIAEYRSGHAFHALLLCGSTGRMKDAFAAYLANLLLCRAEETARPCGACPSCLRFRAGKHGNLLRLGLAPGSKTIRIEQLRGLLSALSLHPLESGPRVILISDLQAMTVQAQNALLKSLEEPLEQDFYLLTCENEQAVLPTVVSRCSFVRLPDADDEKAAGLQKQSASEAAQAPQYPGLRSEPGGGNAMKEAQILAERSFFQVKKFSDIPAASFLLKDAKDAGDLLLDILEQETRRALEADQLGQADSTEASPWQGASSIALAHVLESVFEARKYKASNVSWQSVADRLLFSIAKEIFQCQWS